MIHGRPTAAPAYFPYRHPNMAEMMRREGSIWNCGHPRSVENTASTSPRGRCRECWNAKQRERYQADRARYERERRSARG